MTVREKAFLRKALHVIDEYSFDCDSDIEGCTGEELIHLEGCIQACDELKKRIVNYLTGKVDNPRGVVNGEKPMTVLPKV